MVWKLSIEISMYKQIKYLKFPAHTDEKFQDLPYYINDRIISPITIYPKTKPIPLHLRKYNQQNK